MIQSFNSQRDGILRRGTSQAGKRGQAFQFPTGWNSTILCLAFCVDDYVSIPNGMEFYSTNFAIFLGRKC